MWQPSRSDGILFRKPFKMEAAFTLKERGIRIVFSNITEIVKEEKREGFRKRHRSIGRNAFYHKGHINIMGKTQN